MRAAFLLLVPEWHLNENHKCDNFPNTQCQYFLSYLILLNLLSSKLMSYYGGGGCQGW